MGQVLFLNNPLTGLLVLIALVVDSPQKGALAAVGVVSSVLFARLLKLDRNSIDNGIFGYSPFLIGAALGTFTYDSWSIMPWIFAIDIILSCVSVLVMLSLGATMVKTYGLSPLVMPFLLPIHTFGF